MNSAQPPSRIGCQYSGCANPWTFTASQPSDSHSDVPFLEAVGKPVAVNSDRGLRRLAAERGWPVLRFRERAFPRRVA